MKWVLRNEAADIEQKDKQEKKIKLASAKVAAANLSNKIKCPWETGRKKQ